MANAHSNPKILIAPLNWGLGHATRCMPLIDELLRQGADVSLASDGAALHLLQKEYPGLPAFQLPAFDIQYPTSNMGFNMLSQTNKIRKAIRADHRALEQIVAEQNFQAIISDNRFGCYHASTYNIFMTHQLNIKAPFRLAEKLIARWNKKMIQAFDFCWVPDYENAPRLSGDLSFPAPIDNVRYIGALSRFKIKDEPDNVRDVLVILSGPEPQRTYLETAILQQAKQLNYSFLIVRGKMEDSSRKKTEAHIEVVGHLTSKDLNAAINNSKYIVSRSGYSTIMDLAALEKVAILIPTPGQTEQEYLGRHFHENGVFLNQNQKDLDLGKALEEVSQFSGFNVDRRGEDLLQRAVRDLMGRF